MKTEWADAEYVEWKEVSELMPINKLTEDDVEDMSKEECVCGDCGEPCYTCGKNMRTAK